MVTMCQTRWVASLSMRKIPLRTATSSPRLVLTARATGNGSPTPSVGPALGRFAEAVRTDEVNYLLRLFAG
jgi:hypothetical protein